MGNTYSFSRQYKISNDRNFQNDKRGGISLPAVPVLRKQVKIADPGLQLKGLEEEELRQRKPVQLQKAPAQFFANNDKAGRLLKSVSLPVQKKENNTGLPDHLKTGIENLSGLSMDDVKVHYNSDKPAQLLAHAYAQGTDIHVAAGQEKHLAHEAWHVVQQMQGRVKPTMQMKGTININDDAGLETEADVMGRKAFSQGKGLPAQLHTAVQAKFVIQRMLTLPSAVASDLLHPEYANLFTEWSDAINNIANRANNRATRHQDIVNQITNVGRNSSFSYYDGNANVPALANATDLTGLAGNNREHMYVHHDGTIYRADRNREKRPHSTIVTGEADPDVTCAGTLIVRRLNRLDSDGNTIYDVKVTTNSGHFRPNNVPDATLELIRGKAALNLPADTVIGVRR